MPAPKPSQGKGAVSDVNFRQRRIVADGEQEAGNPSTHHIPRAPSLTRYHGQPVYERLNQDYS